jgi:DNA-directed RNA polymerase sigma subunit (sigma70/sigma32)
MTLDEVGEAMAVTRERARQIEERASSRLRLKRELREVAK